MLFRGTGFQPVQAAHKTSKSIEPREHPARVENPCHDARFGCPTTSCKDEFCRVGVLAHRWSRGASRGRLRTPYIDLYGCTARTGGMPVSRQSFERHFIPRPDDDHASRRSTTSRMVLTGAGFPVHTSNCAAAWRTNISTPPMVFAPAASACASSFVFIGL
ncbi:MAG: hypothetical protein JWP03_4674 [Phycisphaerales bacterium]|nr:hypothetical protein [Phycisphaerales bacterium]